MKFPFFAALPIFVTIAACGGAHQPSLNCELSHAEEGLSSQIERRISATLTDFSDEGVWKFEGKISTGGSIEDDISITGYFFQYDEDKFDLIASTEREQITVMPDNKFLKERGLQGVTMPVGGNVSTGTALSASCQTSLPTVGNQRYKLPEKQ